MARDLQMRREGRSTWSTGTWSVPSYGELLYEEARREGVLFIHLEEGEEVDFEGGGARISGLERALLLRADKVVRFEDYMEAFKE